MSDESVDKASGRVKEAAGALTGNKSLKNKGRAEQAKGAAKDAGDKLAEAVTGRRTRRKV